jgi:hypothetical protein
MAEFQDSPLVNKTKGDVADEESTGGNDVA